MTHNSNSYICLFQFSTCFEQPSAHHRESQFYQYDLWYMSLYVSDRVRLVPSKPAYHTVTYIEQHIPEVEVYVKLIIYEEDNNRTFVI